jgi:hypothetical protein
MPEHASTTMLLRPIWFAAVAGTCELRLEPLAQTPPMSSLHTAVAARSALY